MKNKQKDDGRARIQQEISFLIKQSEFLSLNFKEQCGKSSLPNEMIADDIAEDWDWAFIGNIANDLMDNKILNGKICEKIKKINRNFADVSRGGTHFQQTIWTLEGFENHPFWNNQRQLAKQLLDELKTIQLAPVQ